MPNKIYKSPYVIVCVSVWIVWGLITFTERIYYSNYPEDVFFIWLKVGLVQVFHGIWVTFLLFWVYKKLFYRSLSLPIKALYVIILTYVFSFGLVLLNNPTYMFFFDIVPMFSTWNNYFVIAFSKFFIIPLLSILYILITYLIESQKQKEKTLKAMSVAKDAQLQMLRYQLNPHFLFNALNSIRTLVYEDKEKTDQVITDLSEFLRYSLANQDERYVSIEDEIEVIKNYLRIQKTRFEDKLKININIDDKILKFKIPCFLFHPLVENAMKYGIETSPPPLEIGITGRMVNDTVLIKVQNSGVISKPNDSTCNGTGLKNVRMRLNNYFPEKNSFQLYEDSGNVCAEITIKMSDIYQYGKLGNR